MRKLFGLNFILIMAMIASCGTSKKMIGDTSRNSLDWPGLYENSFQLTNSDKYYDVQLYLSNDNSYKLKIKEASWDKMNYLEGKFTWDKTESTIILEQEVPSLPTKKIKIGENRVFILSPNGTEHIDASFGELFKIEQDDAVVNKYWKLVSINGKKITADDFSSKEPHIIFTEDFSRVHGSDGCNSFNGVFRLLKQSMTFSKMATTMKACQGVEIPNYFNQLFASSDIKYTIKGEQLVLKTKNNTLEFEVVYLK